MNLFTISWGVRHEPGGSYVIEHEDGQPKTTYGPMPAAVVGAFMLERQSMVRRVFDRAIERLNRDLHHGQDTSQKDQ